MIFSSSPLGPCIFPQLVFLPLPETKKQFGIRFKSSLKSLLILNGNFWLFQFQGAPVLFFLICELTRETCNKKPKASIHCSIKFSGSPFLGRRILVLIPNPRNLIMVPTKKMSFFAAKGKHIVCVYIYINIVYIRTYIVYL